MTTYNRWKTAVGLSVGAALAIAVLPGTPAMAQDNGSSEVTVEVQESITIEALTASFTLSGAPGETVAPQEVSLTVTTNNANGYSVSVQPTTADLAPTAVDNADTIPFSAIEVETAPDTFTPLDSASAVVVHSSDAASAETGDAHAHNYQITVPFVQPDTYTGEITYVATATA